VRRGGIAATIVAGLVAAGLALFAATRTWLVEPGLRPAPLPPLPVARTGGALVPALTASAVVGLAAVLALLATRGRARLAVAAVVVAAGAGITASALYGFFAYAEVNAWPIAAAAGGLGLLAVGVHALRRSPGWPAMGTRYERAAATDDDEPRDAAGLWDAIDRGQDPTRRNPS
jgi:hypothetical protein